MSTANLEDLKTLLNHDISSLETLAKLIAQEREALGANDVTALEPLVASKQALLDSIRVSAREKVRHLVALGFKPASGTPSSFLDQFGDEGLASLWGQAQKAMVECQNANSVNGKVINHLQKRAARLSEIIRGVNPNQKLYGAAGREETLGHKTVLANV